MHVFVYCQIIKDAGLNIKSWGKNVAVHHQPAFILHWTDKSCENLVTYHISGEKKTGQMWTLFVFVCYLFIFMCVYIPSTAFCRSQIHILLLSSIGDMYLGRVMGAAVADAL